MPLQLSKRDCKARVSIVTAKIPQSRVYDKVHTLTSNPARFMSLNSSALC